MAPSATRPDIGDGSYRGDSLSQSGAPLHLYSFENNYATNIPTQSVPLPVVSVFPTYSSSSSLRAIFEAAPPSQYPSYPSYGVSFANDMASDYTVRPATQHVAPTMASTFPPSALPVEL